MKYHNITTEDMLNGDGLRVVLWVSGCSHHCKGCQNPQTWNPDGGIFFDNLAYAEIRTELNKDYISGITFSGGDPLYLGHRDEVTDLIIRIKKEFPNKTVWMYTGYVYEYIKDFPVMQYVDVLVDGKFEIDKLDNSLPWKGSSNQRVIDVRKSLKKGEVILYA